MPKYFSFFAEDHVIDCVKYDQEVGMPEIYVWTRDWEKYFKEIREAIDDIYYELLDKPKRRTDAQVIVAVKRETPKVKIEKKLTINEFEF